MAHKILKDGRVVVDWETGDPEKDRIHLLQAYTDFIKEVQECLKYMENISEPDKLIEQIFDKWQISVDNQVDEVPRIWISRPE